MNISGANPNIVAVCGTAVILAVLAVIGILTWHGAVTGQQAMLVIGVIATAAVAIFGVHTGVTAGAKMAAQQRTNQFGP